MTEQLELFPVIVTLLQCHHRMFTFIITAVRIAVIVQWHYRDREIYRLFLSLI